MYKYTIYNAVKFIKTSRGFSAVVQVGSFWVRRQIVAQEKHLRREQISTAAAPEGTSSEGQRQTEAMAFPTRSCPFPQALQRSANAGGEPAPATAPGVLSSPLQIRGFGAGETTTHVSAFGRAQEEKPAERGCAEAVLGFPSGIAARVLLCPHVSSAGQTKSRRSLLPWYGMLCPLPAASRGSAFLPPSPKADRRVLERRDRRKGSALPLPFLYPNSPGKGFPARRLGGL